MIDSIISHKKENFDAVGRRSRWDNWGMANIHGFSKKFWIVYVGI